MATPRNVTTEDLSVQVEQLKTDISALTQTIADLSANKGEELADTVRRRAETARARGEAQLHDLQRQARDGLDGAEDYVRRNPATALGIAAGVGVLVGMLSARR